MIRSAFAEPSNNDNRKGKKNGEISGNKNGKGGKGDGASKPQKSPWLVPAGRLKGESRWGGESLFLSPFRLLMFNHSPAKWQGMISDSRQTIGRAKEAAIRISEDFPGVDSHHACIWANEKGIWLKDLGSQGGTRVNGIPVIHDFGAQIMPGDLIQLGDALLYLNDYNAPSCQNLAAKVLERSKPKKVVRKGTKVADPYERLKKLTRAEYLILLWIHRGFVTDYEIAQQIHRSPHTVRTHVTKLRGTLGVHSRLELHSFIKTLL
jgi:pSer/pThr/pTyr-binding forkhead associated (FHA) protein